MIIHDDDQYERYRRSARFHAREQSPHASAPSALRRPGADGPPDRWVMPVLIGGVVVFWIGVACGVWLW